MIHVEAMCTYMVGWERRGRERWGEGDCCGIPVPSAFAAAKAEQDKLMQPGLRLGCLEICPVLFDKLLYVSLPMLLFFLLHAHVFFLRFENFYLR